MVSWFRLAVAALLCLAAAPLEAADNARPPIVAHRGGTGDDPENTALAVTHAMANGADAIWLTVQMSRDSVPVLYRPKDVSALSDRSGLMSSPSAGDLAGVSVGYRVRPKGASEGDYPYRAAPQGMPTLAAVLPLIPAALPLFFDIKSPDADPTSIVAAVRGVLDAGSAVPRTTINSTDRRYTEATRRRRPADLPGPRVDPDARPRPARPPVPRHAARGLGRL